jgi:hypothetical protein
VVSRWPRRLVHRPRRRRACGRRLADLDFPVERVDILGQDVLTVEQVTGKLNDPTAARRGAAGGAVPGAQLGWISGRFGWADPLVRAVPLALYGLLIGAVIGYVLQGGRRDSASVAFTRPQRLELVVDDDVADEVAGKAARLLAGRV